MKMGALLCWSALSLCLAAPAAAQSSTDLANSYRLEARFNPATGALSVQGTMDVVADRRTENLTLLLNDAMRVRSFTVEGREARIEPSYIYGEQRVPGGQAIVVPLDGALEQGQRARLAFRYDGRLASDNIHVGRGVVSPAWTELTLESFWYPILFEEPLLRSELILELPEQYQVIGPGSVERLAPGRWRLDPEAVVSGRITFAASSGWHVEQRPLGGKLVAALHTMRPEPLSGQILSAVEGAHAYFTRMFGAPRSSTSRIRILLANADVGLKYPNQAFATAGNFIVMSNGEAQGQLDTLHHEVAHLWWAGGQPGTRDEFLSESVSEYLALRYGEERWGAGWLAQRRAAMAARSAEINSSFLRLDGLGSGPLQPLLYDRGPTALWLLHDRVGREAMDALLRETYQRETKSLSEFLGAIESRFGSKVEAWFRSQL